MKKHFLKLTAMLLTLSLAQFSTSCKEEEEDKPSPTATVYEETNGVVRVQDLGEGTGTITWTADKVYLLDGLVFVNSGQTLTIEAGTVIKGQPGQEADASAMIVARGGKIMAEGTAAAPIIFTAEADQLTGNLDVNSRGLWGGLIVLGAAKLNSDPGVTSIEGLPTTEPRGEYGGTNDADNSGVIRYVSIRHGGTDIGEGNEINGLTLGGVGSGTTIEYVEVVANKDDGIEFFGGMPNIKHALVSYCGDDSYDYDEGYRGKGQFWVAIQDAAAGDRIGEFDGGTSPETAQPYAIPHLYNMTFIGRGAEAGRRTMTLRDNAGGFFYNCIFANQGRGIDVEVLIGEQNSFKQLEDGNLGIGNCVFSDVLDGSANFTISFVGDSVDAQGNDVLEDPTDPDSDQLPTAALQAKVAAASTVFASNFSFWGNSTMSMGLSASNPVPSSTPSSVDPEDAWFENVSYLGAFEPGVANHWAKGWTRTFAE